MCDVVVDRRSAGVHAHLLGMGRLEGLEAAGQAVVDVHGHGTDDRTRLTPRRRPPRDGSRGSGGGGAPRWSKTACWRARSAYWNFSRASSGLSPAAPRVSKNGASCSVSMGSRARIAWRSRPRAQSTTMSAPTSMAGLQSPQATQMDCTRSTSATRKTSRMFFPPPRHPSTVATPVGETSRGRKFGGPCSRVVCAKILSA